MFRTPINYSTNPEDWYCEKGLDERLQDAGFDWAERQRIGGELFQMLHDSAEEAEWWLKFEQYTTEYAEHFAYQDGWEHTLAYELFWSWYLGHMTDLPRTIPYNVLEAEIDEFVQAAIDGGVEVAVASWIDDYKREEEVYV